MKATGIVRPVDDLGRVVIPVELRRVMGITDKDSMEIYTDYETIMLKKYAPADIFNGAIENIIEYEGKKVSQDTIIDMCLQLDPEHRAKLADSLESAV